MQIFGIGSLEFLLVVVIAVIVLGPKGLVQASHDIGKLVRKVTSSPIWREVVDTSRELREIPQKLVREVGIEEDLEEIRRSTQGTVTGMKHGLQALNEQIVPVNRDETTERKATGEQEGKERSHG